MSAPTASSVFKPRNRRPEQRRPIWLKRDKFSRHGEALLAAALVAEPLERCLAVVRHVLGVLTDMLRPGGPDPEDQPATTLGLHHVTVRQLGPGSYAGPPKIPAAGATAGEVPPLPRLHVQELVSFDPAEGPKALAVEGPGRVSAVVAHLRVDPRVKVKAKRLGRDVSVKVKLEGGGHVTLWPREVLANAAAAVAAATAAAGPAGASAAAAAAAAAAAGTSLLSSRTSAAVPDAPGGVAAPAPAGPSSPPPRQQEERYTVALPNLVLKGSLPRAALPEFRGDLVIQCHSTGLMACITFKEDGAVKGLLEKARTAQPEAAASAAAPGTPAARAGTPSAGALADLYGVVGTFSGSLHDSIMMTCPELGLEGVVHSEQPPTAGLPPLAQLLDIARPGPQQLPRLWSALYDALLYHDPMAVSGGKAAEELSRRLTTSLHALFLSDGDGRSALYGSQATDARGTPAPAAASTAGGGGGGRTAESTVAGTAADSDTDSDFEAAAQEEGDSIEDPRDVPPSYKAQHAAGRRLAWQVQYTVVVGAAGSTTVAPLGTSVQAGAATVTAPPLSA